MQYTAIGSFYTHLHLHAFNRWFDRRFHIIYQHAQFLHREECAFIVNILPKVKLWINTLSEILEQAKSGLILMAGMEKEIKNITKTINSTISSVGTLYKDVGLGLCHAVYFSWIVPPITVKQFCNIVNN